MGLLDFFSVGINTQPIYSRGGNLSNNGAGAMNQLIATAANDYTGAGANNSLVWTAHGTYGGFVQRIRFKAGGTNIASVARVFINNGSPNTTAANNVFYGECSLPATTANAAGATIDIDYPLNFALDPAYRIYVGLGTTVAAGWVATVIAGRY